MKIRTRKKPRPLVKLDAIIPRLAPNYPRLSEMKQDAAKRQRGYIGEKKVDYYLDNLASRYTIIQDVCLQVNGKASQSDNVICGKHAIYLVEAKHFKDKIIFNTNLRQLIRSDGTIESGFEYPITQIENQQFHLQNYLFQHNMPDIPIHYFVAIADPSTIIEVAGDEKELAKVVAHGARIPSMILEKEQVLADAGQKQLPDWKIGKQILRDCIEYDRDIIRQYGIQLRDLSPGVMCPECRLLGMQRVYKGWKCVKCGLFSIDAHKTALEDFFILFRPYIRNSECMKWLRFDSKNIATKLLRDFGLNYDENYRIWRL
ncbi:nuclease-related domain-containing protein [Virgibacillus ihumii]|uniref:nuclease-related domain-containing protein n=1 Tax=Virgibacillus ihumii TaxID=2686091 RepID=UPI00157CB872|nr:nuclease-related domain-containing protein [Virgibacillus ihumii]